MKLDLIHTMLLLVVFTLGIAVAYTIREKMHYESTITI